MQPIPDTAPTNITEGPKRVLNPAIGNRRERGRCPRHWGIVLGLSERAIYARRPSKGIDEGSNDPEGDRRTAKGIEGDRGNVDPPRRFSKVVGDPRRSSKGRERSSGCPYGLGRRWRWLSRLYREREMPIEGQRCRLAVWG